MTNSSKPSKIDKKQEHAAKKEKKRRVYKEREKDKELEIKEYVNKNTD